MFVLAGRSGNVAEGRALASEMIASGRARDTFREIIRAQGGNPTVVDDPSLLPRANNLAKVKSPRAGFVTAIRSERVGVASMVLGGGREKKEDSVDPAVGLVLEKKVGDPVEAGATLCSVRYNSDARLANAMELLSASFEIGDAPPQPAPLIRKMIGTT
jgi:thymidine phosphorylase